MGSVRMGRTGRSPSRHRRLTQASPACFGFAETGCALSMLYISQNGRRRSMLLRRPHYFLVFLFLCGRVRLYRRLCTGSNALYCRLLLRHPLIAEFPH